MAAPKKVDYERIEPGWRAGIKSPAQLASEYTKETGVSVSHAALIKHFKKLGVPRDLGAKVRAKAEAMVTQAMVTGKVSTETMKPDAEIIDEAAVPLAMIQIAHRTDIARGRKLAMTMLAELEAETGDPALFEQLGEMLAGPEDASLDAGTDQKRRDKLQEAYLKALSLPSRIDSGKKLAETLKHLIGIEREAYGLEGPTQKVDVHLKQSAKDYSDEELAAIAAGSGAGAAAAPPR
jgi:hypothetical protein